MMSIGGNVLTAVGVFGGGVSLSAAIFGPMNWWQILLFLAGYFLGWLLMVLFNLVRVTS